MILALAGAGLFVFNSRYAGKERYTIPNENLKISYPASWTLVSDQNQYTLVSPNNFELSFQIAIDGLGGGCDEECQSHNLGNVVLKTLNFYSKPLYVVVNGLRDDWGQQKPFTRFNVILEKTCFAIICYGFPGLNSQGIVIITGRYVNNGANMPVEEFAKSSDVKTALLILESISY